MRFTRITIITASLAIWAAVFLFVFVAVMPPLPVAAQGAPTKTPIPESPTFTVVGKVSSGTADVSLPSDIVLTLNVVTQTAAGTLEAQTQTTRLSADGTYQFENVTAAVGASIFSTTSYLGVTQGSLIAQVQEGQGTLDLPVTLYAPTSDPAVVTLLRAQYILDFLPGNLMQVLATYYYSVSGDRFFVAQQRNTNGGTISARIPLPIGAQSIAFTNNVNNRFSLGGDANAPVILDSRPIMPGQAHEIVISYQLPYSKGAPIDQDYPFATQMIEVLIPDDAGVELTGDFTSNPNLTINPQRLYTQYNLNAALPANARLIYTLDGVPPIQVATPAGSTASANASPDFLPLILGLIMLIIIIVLISASILRPRRKTS